MAAVWIKPMDRSKFVANMMASSLGAAVAMPICGFLISYSGWESVFYVTGIHIIVLHFNYLNSSPYSRYLFAFK